MPQIVVLNFTSIRYHCIFLIKLSHITNGVLEFYLNSEVLHLSKKPSHVTYAVLEFYLNWGALHLFNKTITCHQWCS